MKMFGNVVRVEGRVEGLERVGHDWKDDERNSV